MWMGMVICLLPFASCHSHHVFAILPSRQQEFPTGGTRDANHNYHIFLSNLAFREFDCRPVDPAIFTNRPA
jgi:hypothetical protein